MESSYAAVNDNSVSEIEQRHQGHSPIPIVIDWSDSLAPKIVFPTTKTEAPRQQSQQTFEQPHQQQQPEECTIDWNLSWAPVLCQGPIQRFPYPTSFEPSQYQKFQQQHQPVRLQPMEQQVLQIQQPLQQKQRTRSRKAGRQEPYRQRRQCGVTRSIRPGYNKPAAPTEKIESPTILNDDEVLNLLLDMSDARELSRKKLIDN